MERPMHRFYSKTKKQQNRILLISALLLFLSIAVITFLSAYYRLYGFMILAGLIFSTFICFIDVPIGKRNGVFIYYSPLLLSTKEKDRTIEIHGGTLFDYYFTLNEKQSKGERKKAIIDLYLDGLLRLINSYDAATDKELKVKATSYIINERTAAKMGFKKAKPDYIQSITVLLNYLPILFAYSYSKARLGFPNIFRIKTFEASIQDLKNKKKAIRRLKNRLENSIV